MYRRPAFRLLALLVPLLALALWFSPSRTTYAAVPVVSETEPNNTFAQATVLDLSGKYLVVTGAIDSDPLVQIDTDTFQFTAPAGARLWVTTDTGGTQLPGANSRDTRLTLYDSSIQEVEFDDDGGTANGGDGTLEDVGPLGLTASLIAGRTLPAGGTYYLSVDSNLSDSVVPYRLIIALTTAASQPEDEPNNTAAMASPLTNGGVRSGQISPAGDVDYYSFDAMAGQLIFFAADGDPERDRNGRDLIVELRDATDTILLTVDGPFGAGPDFAADGASFLITESGTYHLRVRSFSSADTGTYHVFVQTDTVAPSSDVGNFVWHDLNGNGLQDAGEPGLSGVTVQLLDAGTDAVLETTTTDLSGAYSFTPTAGSYKIQVTPPAGYSFTTANAGSDDTKDSDIVDSVNGRTAAFSVTAGTPELTQDAGLVRPVDLAVTKTDGRTTVQPSPVGGPDQTTTYTIVVTNNSPVRVTGVSVQDTIPAGLTNATWTCTLGAGSSCPAPAFGSGNINVNSVALAPNGQVTFELTATVSSGAPDGQMISNTVTVATPGAVTDSDPGNNSATDTNTVAVPVANVQVGNYVWHDLNGNGVQDTGEPGMANVTVHLLDATTNAILQTTSTVSTGAYSFSAPPGNYKIQVVLASWFSYTSPDAIGDDTKDSDIVDTVSGRTASFTLHSGTPDDSRDAGMVRLVDLSVTKTDSRTTIQPSPVVGPAVTTTYTIVVSNSADAQVNGITVMDMVPTELTNASWTCTATTGSSCPASGTGNINTSDVNLLAGGKATFELTATVSSSVAHGQVITNSASAAPPGVVPDANPSDNGAFDTTTVVVPVEVGNYVWHDLNGNGLQDAGEPGIANVTVQLLDATTNAVLQTTTTDMAGTYSIMAAPGSYKIQVTPPAGFSFTTANAGGDDTKDSDISDTATGRTTSFTLVAMTPDVSQDAGLVRPVDLSVTKTDSRTTVQPSPVGGPDVTTTYTIVVSNAGTVPVTGVSVQDTIPAGLTNASWTCTASAGSSCPASGTGNISTTSVNLLAGGTATFQLTATVSSSAVHGQAISNTVTATTPGAVTDSNPANNSATDSNTVAVVVQVGNFVWHDLNGNGLQDMGEPGVANVTVNLLNATTNAVLQTATTDMNGAYSFEAAPGDYKIQVVAPAGAGFTTANAGGDDTKDSDISDTANGRTASFTLTQNSPDTTQDAGLVRPVDLSVTKTDSRSTVRPSPVGGPDVTTTYTIVVTNTSSVPVNGVSVQDTIPAGLTNATWTCTASAGSSCPASGTGNISVTNVNLLAGGTATFQLTATVSSSATHGQVITNTVTVTTPGAVSDPTTGNNSATDTTTVSTATDTTAPELYYRFDPATRGVQVFARDDGEIAPGALSPVTCAAAGTNAQQCIYRAIDGAGNATTLTLTITKSSSQTRVRVVRIQYQGQVATTPLSNETVYDFAPASGALSSLKQCATVTSPPVGGSPSSSTNICETWSTGGNTTVQYIKPAAPNQTRTGMALLQVATKKGALVIETP